MRKAIPIFIFLCFLFCRHDLLAQKTPVKNPEKKSRFSVFAKIDSNKKYNPRIAIARSAILPGWGQATNKSYWKIPIVYAALGITAGVFIHNVKQFRGANNAYKNAIDGDTSNDHLIPEPYYSVRFQPSTIQSFRNQVRQNVDYSALFFILFWGLNVVDATVEAHLKTFDVSDNLSVEVKPGYSPMAHTNGVSLVLHIGKTHSK